MPAKKEDVRGELVENYKLTPEQMKFQKRFKQLKQMQELMQQRSLGLALQMENERELWERLEGEFMRLRAPKQSVKELPGMNFPMEREREEEVGAEVGAEEGTPPWHLKY